MMTNFERYRAAFAHVRAPDGMAQRALERLGEPAPKRRRRLRPLLAAAIAAALLVGSVGAEVSSGAVSNLLAPLFGGAQVELAGDVGIPVGASVSAGGYTLSVDALIGDRYNLAIVYTLTRDDGQPIPEGAAFREWSTAMPFRGSGGGSLQIIREDVPPNQLHIVEEWSQEIPLVARMATTTFSGLAVGGGEGEEVTVLAEGPWEVQYALRYRDSTVKLPIKDVRVTDVEGLEYEIHKALLSPVGLHLDLTAPNVHLNWEIGTPQQRRLMEHFEVSLRLADGSVTELQGNRSGGGSLDDPTYDAHFSARFAVPIPLEDIAAIIICDTEIPVELP